MNSVRGSVRVWPSQPADRSEIEQLGKKTYTNKLHHPYNYHVELLGEQTSGGPAHPRFVVRAMNKRRTSIV